MPEEKIAQPENAEKSQPVVEETSAIPKKKKFSNTTWLVIGLVLLIILGAGGYFLLAEKTTKSTSETAVNTVTPSPMISTSATANDALLAKYQGPVAPALYRELLAKFKGQYTFSLSVRDSSYAQKSTEGYYISLPGMIVGVTAFNTDPLNSNYKDFNNYLTNYFKSKAGAAEINGSPSFYNIGKEECDFNFAENVLVCIYKNGDFQKGYNEQISILKDILNEGFDPKNNALQIDKIDGIYLLGEELEMSGYSPSMPITSAPILLKNVNGVWKILSIGSQAPSCNQLVQKGFTKVDQDYAKCTNSY